MTTPRHPPPRSPLSIPDQLGYTPLRLLALWSAYLTAIINTVQPDPARSAHLANRLHALPLLEMVAWSHSRRTRMPIARLSTHPVRRASRAHSAPCLSRPSYESPPRSLRLSHHHPVGITFQPEPLLPSRPYPAPALGAPISAPLPTLTASSSTTVARLLASPALFPIPNSARLNSNA